MKLTIFGHQTDQITQLTHSLGFDIVQQNPDVILAYGGDGTLISSEREFPGIPKLPIRRDNISQKCPKHQNEIVLNDLFDGKLKLVNYQKLTTSFFYKDFFALNDFVVRNSSPIHSIRFKIKKSETINSDKLYIGDGVVISTPFGSSGYFKSITNKTFSDGFAIAFNNTTELTDPIYLKSADKITLELIRGQATLSYDNNPDIFNLDEQSEISFGLSDQVAKVYSIENLRCPECVVKRG